MMIMNDRNDVVRLITDIINIVSYHIIFIRRLFFF